MSKFDRLQEFIETDFRAICNWVGDRRERRVNPRNLAFGFYMLGEMEHSHRWFQMTLHESKTTKTTKFRDWKYFGRASLATGEGQAMGFFKEALDANPSDRELKHLLAKAYQTSGDWEGVIKIYENMVDHSSCNSWYELANVYERKGGLDGEIGVYERAVNAVPSDMQLWWQYAHALRRKGDWKKCIAAMEKMSCHPTSHPRSLRRSL
jgi:tetratricopeptide (TPR) repeat protein